MQIIEDRGSTGCATSVSLRYLFGFIIDSMSARYVIDLDKERSLLRIELAGFFAMNDVRRWEADRRAALHRLDDSQLRNHVTLTAAWGASPL